MINRCQQEDGDNIFFFYLFLYKMELFIDRKIGGFYGNAVDKVNLSNNDLHHCNIVMNVTLIGEKDVDAFLVLFVEYDNGNYECKTKTLLHGNGIKCDDIVPVVTPSQQGDGYDFSLKLTPDISQNVMASFSFTGIITDDKFKQ